MNWCCGPTFLGLPELSVIEPVRIGVGEEQGVCSHVVAYTRGIHTRGVSGSVHVAHGNVARLVERYPPFDLIVSIDISIQPQRTSIRLARIFIY
jgi:hypothetical protein